MSRLLKVLMLLLVTIFTPTTAYVNDSELFPYSESAGSFRYYFGDDGNVEVFLTQTFKFLGITYSAVYISGNGYITFGTGVTRAGYECNKLDAAVPTVAVYMADADNRSDMKGAQLLYRQDTTNSSLNKISKDVFAAFPHLQDQITLNWMLIVTWYNIPPYDGIKALVLRNTFQAILTTDTTGDYSFILMYYSNITWPELTQGDTAARVGIYGGKETFNNHFFLIPGSCSYSLLNIGQMTNFEQPGKLAFKVDTRVELPPFSVSKCINSTDNRVLDVEFKPYIVYPLQKLPFSTHKLELCIDVEVNGTTCIFYDNRGRQMPKEVVGRFYPSQYKATCTPPDIDYSLGKMRVDVRLSFKDGNQILASGYVYVVKLPYNNKLKVNVVYDDMVPPAANLTVHWAESDFRWNQVEDRNGESISINESAYLTWSMYELNSLTWATLYSTAGRQFPNETQISKPLKYELQSTFASERLEAPPRVMTVSNYNTWQFRERTPASLNSDIVYTTMLLAQMKINSTGINVYDKKCKQWYDHEPQPPNDTLACPPTVVQAIEDWRFSVDIDSAISASPIMNPHDYTVYLQSVPSPSGAGSQCSYDNQGNLVIGNSHGSRMHRYSPNNWRDYWEYYWDDMMPYLQCCELSSKKEENCARFYYPKRPVKFGYMPPTPFRASGATNIATLDGKTFLLNNIGTFYLLKYENQLEVQILSEMYFGQNSTNNSAVITSAAIRTFTSAFQVSANESGGLLIWQDNQPVNFYHDKLFYNHKYKKESFTVYHEGVNVLINGTSEAIFSFSTGFSVKFMLSSAKSINIIGSVSLNCKSCVGAVTGLIGNCDGDPRVDDWRIPKNDSLFQFDENTYENYNNVSNLPPYLVRDDILHSASDDVKMICGNVEDCQVDYILTEDEDIAKSSIVAYEQFQKMVNASKIRSSSRCPKMIVQNGKFEGNDLNVGASVKPTCEPSYNLNFINNYNSNLKEDASFICVPSNLLTRYNNATTLFPANEVVWVSSTFYQPLSNFLIECKSVNNSVTQNVTYIPTASLIKHCAYPGDNDFGIETLVEGSVLQITCPVHGKTENVTFSCMDQGNSDESFGWVAVNNPFLSLNVCLTARDELAKSLYSPRSSNNSNTSALTFFIMTTIVLVIAVVVLTFYLRKKSSGLAIMATYSRPSMTTNLLESHDSMDN